MGTCVISICLFHTCTRTYEKEWRVENGISSALARSSIHFVEMCHCIYYAGIFVKCEYSAQVCRCALVFMLHILTHKHTHTHPVCLFRSVQSGRTFIRSIKLYSQYISFVDFVPDHRQPPAPNNAVLIAGALDHNQTYTVETHPRYRPSCSCRTATRARP